MDNLTPDRVIKAWFCPNCGAKEPRVNHSRLCLNCNKTMFFSVAEYKEMSINNCFLCGSKVKTSDSVCEKCYAPLKLEEWAPFYVQALEFDKAGNTVAAALNMKKLIPFKHYPEMMYLVYSFLAHNVNDLVMLRYAGKYDNLDYMPREVFEDRDLRSIPKYCEKAKLAFDSSSKAFKQFILSNSASQLMLERNNLMGKKIPKDIIRSREIVSKIESKKCFIATAVYGSSESPEVLILRSFRDTFLLPTNIGTLFVKTYYRCSPPIADYLANSFYLKRVVKWALDLFVGFLGASK